jgi:DNA-directed RNA polymerase subunit K/omega
MDDMLQEFESGAAEAGGASEHAAETTPVVPAEPLPPITSRFLFVDVAALRAKQLRRGAKIRYHADEGIPAARKPERVAMEEVRRGLVYYDVPAPRRGRIVEGDEA